MDMIRIGAAGIAGAMLAVQLKHMKSEYAVYVSLTVSIFIFYYALYKLHIITETIETLQKELSIRAVYLKTLLKIAGITYVSEFSSAICKDAGYQAMGAQIELFCKLSVMVMGMPVLLALLETIEGFLS